MTNRPPESKLGRLLQELGLVPWWGYAASALLVVILVWLFGDWYIAMLKRAYPHSPTLLAIVPPLAVTVLWVWFVMISYVALDARRRRMSVPLWTLLVIIIPNALGFVVYLLLREPIPVTCPKCSASVRSEFAFCPVCGQALAPACPACHHAVEVAWVSCAFCGAKLS